MYRRPKQKIRYRRCQERRKQSVHAGHSHAQGNVSLREVGDYVAARPARTCPHEDNPCHQRNIKRERYAQPVSQSRHNDKLSQAPQQNILWLREHQSKVLEVEGQSHSEHYDH